MCTRPYARYLYYGKVMVDPDTGSAWARRGVTKVATGKDLDIKKAVHDQAQPHWFEASKAQNLEKLLDRLGDWAGRSVPDLSPGVRALRVETTARAALLGRFKDGDEDHQILMKMTYEVI